MPKNHNDSPPQKLAAAWKRLADISPGNRNDADKFLRLKYCQGAKSSTLALYALALRHLDDATHGKEWTALDPDDATLFLSTLRLKGLSHDTIQTQASYCKAFLKWAMDEPQLPPRLQFAFRVLGNHKLPDRPIITEAEEASLMDACRDLREQVILGILIEVGYRINELSTLNVGSVEFDDSGGAWLSLPYMDEGLKTGPRDVYCVKYADLLRAYLSIHEGRDDPSAALLLPLDNRRQPRKDGRLGPQGLWKILSNVQKRADVRPFRPHDLRHTSATRFSEACGDAEALRDRYGWGPNSKMIAHYVHHSRAHKERLARRAAGISEAGTNNAGSGLKTCPTCAEDIKAAAKKCKHCGEILVTHTQP